VGSKRQPPWKLPSYLLRDVMASSTLIQFLGLAATTLIGIQLARGLGVSGYGEYGIAFAAISLLGIPGELGLPRLVMREVASAHAHDDNPALFGILAWANRTVLLTCACLMVMTAAYILLRFGTDLPSVYLAILVGIPLLPIAAATSIRTNALMGLHQYRKGQVPVLLARPMLFSILLFALFEFQADASAADAMALNVLTAVAALIMAGRWLRGCLPAGPPGLVERGGDWLKSGLSLALVDGLRLLHGQIGILLLGILASSHEAGLFRVAVSAVLVVAVPVTIVETVTSPQFARLFRLKDTGQLQRLATRAARLTSIGLFATCLPVLLFGRALISFFFGPEFEPAFYPLVVLCMGQLLNGLFGMNLGLLMMGSQEKRLTRAMAIAIVPNVLVAALLIPRFGAMGAATGSVLYVFVCNVFAWHDAWSRLGVNSAIILLHRNSLPIHPADS
jgi:O-antigen/teichoic acid export membrane protein